jgi:RNA polymerase sigma factor (sigma-70 family)
MAKALMDEALRRLRRAVLARDGGGLSDGELLERFVARREEAAFEALVRRLGPMVLRLCRRILRNHHDAEDAFQAAFIVLARKAASVRPRERVGPFVYGVAYHTALKARAQLARRRRRESPVDEAPEPAVKEQGSGSDLWPVLDQEVCRLAEKYRAPVVLCDLEGLTRKEAAHRLGWPEGTVSGRLSRARALLARRLTRRGVTLAAALTGWGANNSMAAVPAALVRSTVRAAGLVAAGNAMAPGAIFMQGALRSMFTSKGKVAAMVLVLAGLLALAIPWPRSPQVNAEPPAAETPPSPRPAPPPSTDQDRLQGTWKVVAHEANGQRREIAAEPPDRPPADPLLRRLQNCSWTFKGNELTIAVDRQAVGMPFALDVTKNPRRINLFNLVGVPLLLDGLVVTKNPRRINLFNPAPAGKKETYGIYKLEGDRLTVCLAKPGMARVQRPAEFETEEGVAVELLVLVRESCGDKPKAAAKEEAPKPARVGQVFIVGNKKTPQDVILKHVAIFPGQVLTYPDLQAAEKNLAKHRIVATITVVNPENDSDFKDILIEVQEGKTGSLLFGIGTPKPDDKKAKPK